MLPHHHDDDPVPGTVYLVDVNGQATSDLHDASHKDILLVPRPSSDPNDPLNWSRGHKLLAVSMAYLYVFGTGIATSLQYSVLADIMADTGISTANLVEGTGVMFLFFGWACLIWQPIALTYSRRRVYINVAHYPLDGLDGVFVFIARVVRASRSSGNCGLSH
jgi:hypothetical protein